MANTFTPQKSTSNYKTEQDVTFETQTERAIKTLGYSLTGVLAGAIERTGTSLGIVEDKDTISNLVRNVAGEGAANYYDANKEGLQLAGDVGLLLAPIFAVPKLLRTGSFAMKALERVPNGAKFAKIIQTTGKAREERIAALSDEMKVFAEQGLQDIAQLKPLQEAMRRERISAGLDTLKEGLGIDATLLAIGNESDLIFPAEDSITTNFLLYGVPNIAFPVLAYKFTGAALMRAISDIDEFAKTAEAARNRGGIAFGNVTTSTNNRGLGITASAAMYNDAANFKTSTKIASEGKSAAEDRMKTAEEWLFRNIKSAYQDNFIPEIPKLDGKFYFDSASSNVKGDKNFFISEPSLGLTVRSIQPMRSETSHLQNLWDESLISQTNLLRKTQTELKAYEQRLIAGELTSAEEKTYRKLQEKASKLQGTVKKLETHNLMLRETNGALVPLQYRKFTPLDDPKPIGIKKKQGVWELVPEEVDNLQMQISFTDTGRLVINPANKKEKVIALKKQSVEEQVVNQINVYRTLNQSEANLAAQADKKLNLLDITFTYAQNGRIGKDLFTQMPQEFRNALDEWKGSSRNSKIRQWAKLKPQKLDELQNQFKAAGLHKRLFELADSNGMIKLYRGSSGKFSEDVVSMTPHIEIAKKFGTIHEINIPVDDVIGIIDRGRPDKYDAFGKLKPGSSHTISHEFEFIVKGNKNRIPYSKALSKAQKSKDFENASFAEIKNLTFDALSNNQVASVWKAARHILKNWKPEELKFDELTTVGNFLLKPEDGIVEFDLALELAKKFPNQKVINYSANRSLEGQALIDELQYRSFLKKAESYWTQMQAQKGLQLQIYKGDKSALATKHEILRRVNLPGYDGYNWHPLVQMLDSLMPEVGSEIPNAKNIFKSLDDVTSATQQYVKQGKLFETRQQAIDFGFDSRILDYKMAEDSVPSVFIMKNASTNRIGPEELNGAIQTAMLKRWVDLRYASASQAGAVAAYVAVMNKDTETFKTATDVQKLIESSQAGSGIVTSAAFNNRFNEVLRAADLISDAAGKSLINYIEKEVFNPETAKLFATIASDQNSGSRQAIEIAIAQLRYGWNVAEAPVEIGAGKFGFQLKNDARNKKLWAQLFPEDDIAFRFKDDKTPLMPMSFDATQSVVMDELGLTGLKKITEISHKYLDNVNFLRSVEGLNAIPKRAWHVPFYDIRDKNALYLVDESGDVITQLTAKTQDEVLRLAQSEADKLSKKTNQIISIQGDEYVKSHIQMAGQEFMQKQNFGRAGTQTGGIAGKSGTLTVQLDTFKSTLEQLQSNFISLQQHAGSVVFRPQIEYARGIKQFLTTAKTKVNEKTSIYDMLERAYLQKGALNENSVVGKFSYGFEKAADMAFAKLWDKYHSFVPKSVSPTQAEFDRLNKTLSSQYNPFNDFADFVAKTNKVKNPFTLRKQNSMLSRTATNLVLRILDPGMYLINMASVFAVAPAVVASLQKGKAETKLQHLRRTMFIGSQFGEDFVLPQTSKLLQIAGESLFDKEAKLAYRKAIERYGLDKQEVAERLEIMVAPLQTRNQRAVKKFVDNASWFTDKSEQLSRRLSFGMGYNIAKKAGGLLEEDAILFAHKFANDVVGDYRAINRPQIFQGATGMPFSLFTTWAWNWMQRVYGDMEGGRLGALTMGAGLHFFAFGAESMPGYQPFMQTFTTSYDGKNNLTDTMRNAWGDTFVDYFLSGTLANAPKLFGMQDGIALQSRMSVGIPALIQGIGDGNLFEAMPAYRVFSDLLKGTNEVIQGIYENGDYTSEQFLNTLANYSVNGAIKNLAEQALGHSVDRNGNVVNPDVRRLPEILARTFELQTLTERRIQQELSKDRYRAAIKRDHLLKLDKQIRIKMQAGKLDGAAMSQIFRDAIRAGIAPGNLRAWFRDQIVSSVFTKPQREMLKMANDSTEMQSTIRLMELMQKQEGY